MTEYPRDQFDDVPEYRDRQGSHRAVAEPSGGSGPSGLTWISLAAALALAIGAFSFFILPTLRSTDGAGPEAAGASSSGTASASASAAPGAPTEDRTPGAPGVTEAGAGDGRTSEPDEAAASAEPPAATAGSGSPEPSESPEPTATPEPTPSPEETEEPAVVDYSLPVEVYNASRVNGLAGRVGGALAGSGFTVATADNWAGFPVTSSAVFYSSEEATAQAVAARLGLPAVYDGRIPGIAVVVTAAYAG
ncbi:MAG: LytR C-terminal domain-containing protein [Micrococcus sp.]|nr:LytR C-terminal domain-containing protein [Micrococcus sp.]